MIERDNFHPNNGLFFLLTIKYRILRLKKIKEVPEYAEMRYDNDDVILT